MCLHVEDMRASRIRRIREKVYGVLEEMRYSFSDYGADGGVELDSLDAIGLGMGLEDAFGIKITDEELEELVNRKSLGGLLRLTTRPYVDVNGVVSKLSERTDLSLG